MTINYSTLVIVPFILQVLFCPTHSDDVLSARASGEDVVAQLKKLATFSDDPNPAVTRIIFTDNDVAARNYIKELMKDASLSIREDAMGNIYGRMEGCDSSLGAIVTGSHTDAIPLAGMYDGTLGVIGAIAALKSLKDSGFKPKHSIDALMFTSEEPTRFGLGCIGSRGMAGVLTPEFLSGKLDVNGSDFQIAARAVGYGGSSLQDTLDKTLIKKGEIAAFVELHIEQGPLLEEAGEQLGIVTAIAAPAALRVRFKGEGGHAGALLMPYRHDAGLAAAELALAVEKAVLSLGTEDTVGTTGFVEISPNTVNSVPRDAKLEIDVRDIDGNRRDSVVSEIYRAAKDIAELRGVEYSIENINQDPPATCSDQVIAAAEKAVKQLSASHRRMVSRAYHDSLFMAQIAPTGMIFIPCRKGWSHRPDEYSSPADIGRGVDALAITLAELAGSCSKGDSRTEL